MERLTQHTPNGASLILDNPGHADEARQQVTAKFMLACNRLAAYEDTGLMPDEVALYVKCQAQSVSRRELQLGREIERLQAQLAEAQKRADNMAAQLAEAQRREQAMVEVVRCKECKHADPLYASNSPKQIGYICQYTDEKMLETDFCSYGEAKEVQHG